MDHTSSHERNECFNRRHLRADEAKVHGLRRFTTLGVDVAKRSVIAAVCSAMSAFYFWLAWQLIFTWRIGPIISTISAEGEHGIHSGDVLALPLVGLGLVTAVAGLVAATGRIHRPRNPRLPEYRPTFA